MTKSVNMPNFQRAPRKPFMELKCDTDMGVDDFHKCYEGEWNSEEEYAEQLVENCCMLEGTPECF